MIPPYGFDAGPDGKLTPNEAEQKVIALVRDYRAAGMSMDEIRAVLEDVGLAAPKTPGGAS